MRGMILAAGLGTRLRPLSFELPKPVVPVLGQPLCTYNMEFLRRSGIKSFVMNLHTQPRLIRKSLTGWGKRTGRIEFSIEPIILGTGGGIWNAREFLKESTFVTMNGDMILSFPFASALAYHRKKKALATLVLFPDSAKRYTPVWVGEEGRITGFGSVADGGTRSGFYTGCQIVEPELLSKIPPSRASCIIRETYTPLVADGAPVHGFLSSGSFQEFGTIADYLDGTLALLSGRRRDAKFSGTDDSGVTIIPPVHISPRAKIAPGAHVGPGAVIEDGATVADGASVTRSILWPGAVLPEGEKLDRSILTPRRRIQVG
jgi:NDP-sugar pyrophosphorylase family protein